MYITKLTCPNCNVSLEIDEGIREFSCPNCGSIIILEETLDTIIGINAHMNKKFFVRHCHHFPNIHICMAYTEESRLELMIYDQYCFFFTYVHTG